MSAGSERVSKTKIISAFQLLKARPLLRIRYGSIFPLEAFRFLKLLFHLRYLVAGRKTADEFFADRDRTDRIVHYLDKETDLVEQAVFMLGILPLRDPILLERFLRLPGKPERVPKVGPHIGVIASLRDRFLILPDRFGPLLMIVSQVPLDHGRVGRNAGP